MLTVALNKARFVAPIGLYPQEEVLYNQLEVDIALSIPAQIDDQLPFIDYVVLHQLVKTQVLKGEKLLEQLLQHIVVATRELYPDCAIRLSIRKLNPPMEGEVGSSEVSWQD